MKPKKGRALLWPSTLDAQPDQIDIRTTHEVLNSDIVYFYFHFYYHFYFLFLFSIFIFYFFFLFLFYFYLFFYLYAFANISELNSIYSSQK